MLYEEAVGAPGWWGPVTRQLIAVPQEAWGWSLFTGGWVQLGSRNSGAVVHLLLVSETRFWF